MFNPFSGFPAFRVGSRTPTPEPVAEPVERHTVIYRYRSDCVGLCGDCASPIKIGDGVVSLPSEAPERRIVLCESCSSKLGEEAA